ncbi:MAG TPA: dihydrofolate reductase [Bacteroidales bacterium]|nr:dihydrofolate reductase [Bacteroidales bacterium]
MKEDDFYKPLEQFADIRILRYRVEGFEELPLPTKKLIYYLSRAALSGRDIIYDQNGKFNLLIRRTLETIYTTFRGKRDSDDFREFKTYLKRIWFANGVYHHYSNDKFLPGFSEQYFRKLMAESSPSALPEQPQKLLEIILPVLFNPEVFPKKVDFTPDRDKLLHSAVNFYEKVTETEALEYYRTLLEHAGERPASVGLNSKLVKEDGQLKEYVWKAGGMYDKAIVEVMYWLKKAMEEAPPEQKEIIGTLISFYSSGDLALFDHYNILWVKETSQPVDFINGFIETYNDPLGFKGTWESVVHILDAEATERTRILAAHAQWFEDHSPVDERFKKETVTGISARTVNICMLGGDCHPATPIGINLPNSDWIRKEHGSKSVTLKNITEAYHYASLQDGFLEEFAASEEEVDLIKKYGLLADNLHTDMHECLGHGSGQLLPGVRPDALMQYHSVIEEARADLYALYFMYHPKIFNLGLLPHPDAARAEYMAYIRAGLFTQLVRVEYGKPIEEAHMRNRALIARWCFEQGKKKGIIRRYSKGGKTYFAVQNFDGLHELFGILLAEIQRIKSEGDFRAAQNLVETYGVHVERSLHAEVLERYKKLNLAPYSGFVNPTYVPVLDEDGRIKDVRILYKESFAEQMMGYSQQLSFL